MFEIIVELLLQVISELIAELSIRSTTKPSAVKKESNPILAFIGYAIFGAIFGFVSVVIFPDLFLKSEFWIYINLIVTPIVAGLVMASIGFILRKKGKRLIRLDKFFYGYGFALSYTVVRFVFAT